MGLPPAGLVGVGAGQLPLGFWRLSPGPGFPEPPALTPWLVPESGKTAGCLNEASLRPQGGAESRADKGRLPEHRGPQKRPEALPQEVRGAHHLR